MERGHRLLTRRLEGARVPSARAAFALAVLAACAPPPPAPSALLVTLDTTRADALGCYGNPQATSPNLDALAGEALLFERARTTAPITLPAHASMLTGLYPPRHTLRVNNARSLPPSAVTLAERARAAGLETAAFLAAVVLDPAFGLDQGFECYDAPPRSPSRTASAYAERSAEEVVDAFLTWHRRRERARPFLAWVHFFDPHRPYAPPAPFVERVGGDPYLGEVAATDHALGRLLDELGRDGTLERTWVIVVGDHGESLGQHGEPTHSLTCYEPALRVPLLVRSPDGARAGERSDETVSVVDVFPTLLAALDLGPAGDVDGIDLFGAAVDARAGVYFESYAGHLDHGWSPLAGWADEGGKYVHSSRPELFDPRTDPGEETDLLATSGAEVSLYRRHLERLAALPALVPERAGGDARHLLAELERLGYAGSGARDDELPEPLAAGARPSPHDRMGEAAAMSRAAALGDTGNLPAAVAALEAVLDENPHNLWARRYLGTYLLALDREEEAEPHFRRLVVAGALRAATVNSLGVCLERRGSNEAALLHYRRAAGLDPRHRPSLTNAAALCERLGRPAEAEAWRARLALLDP
ncbi:MAG: sulfatase-like hydrolase/transferase [Planctomycetota bacterium]|nr:sulfatase-like hydrolase/transferase [Planctomycetota bacterium]